MTRRTGFALVTVLWVVALLAAIATSLTGLGHRMSLLVRNHGESLQAAAIADGGLRWTMAALIADRDQVPLGSAFSPAVQWRDGEVRVVVSLEADRVDLHRVDADAIAALLRRHGATAGDADRWARAIKRGNLRRVDQLLRIPDLPPDLFATLEPELTLYGGAGVYRIVAEAKLGSGTLFKRLAIVELTPGSRRPLLLDWREVDG